MELISVECVMKKKFFLSVFLFLISYERMSEQANSGKDRNWKISLIDLVFPIYDLVRYL